MDPRYGHDFGQVRVYADTKAAEGGPTYAGASSGSLSGAASTSTKTLPACQVKSFKMTFDAWNIDWPGWLSGATTIRLPVDFELVLEDGVKRSDCLIGQDKRGQVEMGGRIDDVFPTWTKDAPHGALYWWDGERWEAGTGDWSLNPADLFNESADFEDEPGFNDVEQDQYPLYWGGVGHKGHFMFRTYVKDRNTRATVRQLTWGMLIDYSAPKQGRHFFSTAAYPTPAPAPGVFRPTPSPPP